MPENSSPHPLASPPLEPSLSVVIVNYDGWPDVERLTSSLARSPEVASGRCEIVVVDNASPGPVPSSLRSPARGIRLILREDNGGFAVGVNCGWRAARAPWLLLLNPDVQADPLILGTILAKIEAYASLAEGPPAIVGFALRNEDGSRQPSVGVEPALVRSLLGQFIPRSRRKYQAGWRTRAGEVSWVTGACLLVDARVMESTGGLDEDFFLYYEEVAFCRKARDQGRRVEYDPTIEVAHLKPLQGREVSPSIQVVLRHSKLLYFRKHLPRWQFLALTWIVSLESLVRKRAAIRRGDRPRGGAWTLIGTISRAMRHGAEIRGREAKRMADLATKPDGVRISGRRGRRRITDRATVEGR